jgi:hypothetical protein
MEQKKTSRKMLDGIFRGRKAGVLVLAVMMVMAMMSAVIFSTRSDAEGEKVKEFEVTDPKGLYWTMKDINSDTSGADEYVVRLKTDVSISELDIRKNVTILGEGHTMNVSKYGSIYVSENTLSLGKKDASAEENKLTIKSGWSSESDAVQNYVLIQLNPKGTNDVSVNMYDGVTLQGDGPVQNYLTAMAVYVGSGSFNMYGGDITGFKAVGKKTGMCGVVAVQYFSRSKSYPVFNMYGGRIHDNDVEISGNHGFTGAVTLMYGASFNMAGGEISNNRITSAAGEHAYGGGVAASSNGRVNDLTEDDKILGDAIGFGGSVTTPEKKVSVNISGGSIVNNDTGANGCGGGIFVNGDSDLSVSGTAVITGNKAKYGGGIYNNAKNEISVADGVMLANNTASGAGNDFFQLSEGSKNVSARLPKASSMNARYTLDSSDDPISAWFDDKEGARFVKDAGTEVDVTSPVAGGSSLAAGPKTPEYGVTYEFKSSDGTELPDEVMALLPSDTTSYKKGTEVAAKAPSSTTVSVSGGTWKFEGYDREKATADGPVTFTGTWRFNKYIPPEITPEPELFHVKYVFRDTDGRDVPDEVKALLPVDNKGYLRGARVTPIAPAKTTVIVYDASTAGADVWTFVGYDKEYAVVDGDVTFTGTWKKVRGVSPETDDPGKINKPEGNKDEDSMIRKVKKPTPDKAVDHDGNEIVRTSDDAMSGVYMSLLILCGMLAAICVRIFNRRNE